MRTVREHLEAAAKAEPSSALAHLRQALESWAETKALPAKEAQALANRWVELLAKNSRTPAEVEAVLVKLPVAKLSRQVLYQRYMEQRLYAAPFPFAVLIERPHGRDVRLRAVFLVET